MNFKEKRLQQLGVKSLGSFKHNPDKGPESDLLVKGPSHFDAMYYGWARCEVLGVLGDSSAGKTEFCLLSAIDILRNNPEAYVVFVSLEMKTERLATRVLETLKEEHGLADRFLVLSRYDENGVSKDVSIDWVVKELREIKDVVGDISTIIIDHLHSIGSNDMNVLNLICLKVKELAVELNAFVMLLAQVSKTHGKGGEVPLTSDAVFGVSQFKWVSTDIIQIHRPIKRYESDAGISVMGYSYVKVREPHKLDKLAVGQNKLLKYDLDKRQLVKMSVEDYTKFKMYYSAILEAREKEERKTAHEYDLSKEIMGKDGKVVMVNEKYSGDTYDD